MIETGLPLICFEGWVHVRNNQVKETSWAIAMGSRGDDTIALKPRVLPFLLNVLLFGSIAFAIIRFVSWRRERRLFLLGKCPVCEYDLTANTTGTCPECGHVITTTGTSADVQ